MAITLEKSIISDNGDEFIRYLPVLSDAGECRFTGRVTFAFFDCPLYAGEKTHKETKEKALDNVRQVLLSLTLELPY